MMEIIIDKKKADRMVRNIDKILAKSKNEDGIPMPECDDPSCPGDKNRRKLKLYEWFVKEMEKPESDNDGENEKIIARALLKFLKEAEKIEEEI